MSTTDANQIKNKSGNRRSPSHAPPDEHDATAGAYLQLEEERKIPELEVPSQLLRRSVGLIGEEMLNKIIPQI
jgi:hypothetical protein